MSNALEVSNDTFESEVLECATPVLVDFWADWCIPCKMVAPAVDAIADDFVDEVKVAKIDVDANSELAVEYGVRGIPSLMIFYDGEVVERMVGVQSQATIAAKLRKVLAGKTKTP